MDKSLLRNLPSVNDILDTPLAQRLKEVHDHGLVTEAIRREIAEVRERLSRGESLNGAATAEQLAAGAEERLRHELRPKLRRVINGTGIILHTNLGRAPIAEAAARAAYEAAHGYLNLELDLDSGKRSSRQNAVREWICRLTGAEAATAVNNNAAATVIALRALCSGQEVIVSRGQLIEIGGSFRIPEIMAVSGAVLREVGTTNITRLRDFEKAIGPNTAALLRIHPSNYRVSGFTESVPLADLVSLGQKHNLKVIDDIGSGALLDFAHFGFQDEPVARASVAAGADLVLFSGDKLLGGPQAGILAGRRGWIERIETDPLMRAFRLDKMTLAALETTLRTYLNPGRALLEIPILRMLSTPLAELHSRAETLAKEVANLPGVSSAVAREDAAFVGGGSLPDQQMATWVVDVQAQALGDEDFAKRLRTGSPAVLGRLRDGKMVIDARTVTPDQDVELIEAIRAALKTDC
jgi:L-seryl-tRNA(Ser) seleniumtransferase